MRFQLQKLADGAGYAVADRITVINGSHSLLKHLMMKSAGKIVYDTDNLHNVTFAKTFLSIQTTTADQWPGGTGGAKHINVIIPLNRYNFFEELDDKMLVLMQLQLNISFNEDDEIIHAANGVDARRVVIDRFCALVTKINTKRQFVF